ncbi:MAG: hypothetical protein ACD_51C00333G0009 [uncultured bacterium]|nr:MAG: hypothetical protein ACD_51C00333G0009 [uncultured bacterium]OGJ47352.1 MAG: hypothetical protein A2244_02580 [Candidatus Peregrinibacteria bacterium RIFOXYA2_FULL_41_18]OGJ48839.1 MAG: hypothetical protein A2344_02625 [Candidatus Peregrinibacteria bacterium RIFOXYB12_FULL_41_12]
MDITKLFSIDYLLNTIPGAEFKYLWVCAAFFLLLIVFGQYLRVFIKRSEHKKILKRLLPRVHFKLATTAFFGFVLLFFRTQNIPYLATRILLILILALGIYQLARIVYVYAKIFPQELGEFKKKEHMLKYMPKKK